MRERLYRLWGNAKTWRTIPLGPVSVIYRMGRTVRVSSNTRRALLGSFDPARILFGANHGVGFIPRNGSHEEIATYAQKSDRPETALIVGVGPGLGFAAARRLAASGMHVALVSRNADCLDPLVRELRSKTDARAYGCDATDELSVRKMMALVVKDMGVPHLVMYSVQGFCPGRVIDTEVAAFEESWRQNCLGAFIITRESARRMVPLHRGTLVLVGSPSGMIGRADHLNLAVGKFGLRALSQVLARELSREGIHVVHLVIDADIDEGIEPVDSDEPKANPEHIAEVIVGLHLQQKSAWTNEVDVRPWNESFWEHC